MPRRKGYKKGKHQLHQSGQSKSCSTQHELDSQLDENESVSETPSKYITGRNHEDSTTSILVSKGSVEATSLDPLHRAHEALAKLAAFRASNGSFQPTSSTFAPQVDPQLVARDKSPENINAVHQFDVIDLESGSAIGSTFSPVLGTPVSISKSPSLENESLSLDRQTPIQSVEPYTPNHSTTNRASWTNSMEEKMMQVLQKARNEGYQSDGGFKSRVYEMISNEISNLSNHTISAKQVKSKLEAFKVKYKIWRHHLASTQSGWSLNAEGIPESSEEVMDTYFRIHSDRRWCRNSKPKWLEYLDDILGERLATGSNAYDITDISASLESRPRDKSRNESEASSDQSSVSLPTRSASHKRAASSPLPPLRPGKFNSREFLGNAIEIASGNMQTGIERIMTMLEQTKNSEKSHIQIAMEILNVQFKSLSQDMIVECADALSRENRAEVFVHIREDSRTGYLNTILRREGSSTILSGEIIGEESEP